MGCDIHLFVERRYQGRWVPVDPPRTTPYGLSRQEEYKYRGYWNDWGAWLTELSGMQQLANVNLCVKDIIPDRAVDWSFGRNYEAFGQLAGVRRVHLGPYIPLRYIPLDASPPVEAYFYSDTGGKWKRNDYRQINGQEVWASPDIHSTHWYSLEELEEGARQECLTDRRIRQLIGELRNVAEKYQLDGSKVRIVFGFDN